MSRPYVLGSHCALYYVPFAQRSATWPCDWATGVTEQITSTNFVLVSKVGDVTVDLGGNIVEIPTRNGNGWKQSINALKNGDLTFQMVYTPDDQICRDFLYANIYGCPIAVAALDGCVSISDSGTRIETEEGVCPASPCSTGTVVMGLWADFTCSMSLSQPLNNLVLADISLTPTIGEFSPEWVYVGLTAEQFTGAA